MLHRIGAALVVLLVPACASPEAWAGKVGAEFRVNTTTFSSQWSSNVAALGGGGFAVVWDSLDGSFDGVYGQLYNAAGRKRGQEFQISTYTKKSQNFPAVAALKDGGFIVTWISWGQDASGPGIYGQRYDADGIRVGAEFRVNTTIFGWQTYPSVVGLTNGGFVIIWLSDGPAGFDAHVRGQVFAMTGAPVGPEFEVNALPTNRRSRTSVAALRNGGFLVAWNSPDADGEYVFCQRYTNAGAKVGTEFKAVLRPGKRVWSPVVAGLGNGGFVVSWTVADADSTGVFAQRFSRAGLPQGENFRVNTYTPSYQGGPSAAGLLDGGFIVTWTSSGQDGSKDGIYGQRYSAMGASVGNEFQINTNTENYQQFPSGAALGNGGFVVIWDSWQQDGNGYGVYGQRFGP